MHQKSVVLVFWILGTQKKEQKNPKNIKNIKTSRPESFLPET